MPRPTEPKKIEFKDMPPVTITAVQVGDVTVWEAPAKTLANGDTITFSSDAITVDWGESVEDTRTPEEKEQARVFAENMLRRAMDGDPTIKVRLISGNQVVSEQSASGLDEAPDE